MSPQISIIIPSLDSHLIDKTLAALGDQRPSSRGFEIVVVGRDAPGLVPRDGSLRFLETAESLNAGAARNLGMSATQGELVLFTDADCRPAPDWASRLSKALETYAIVGGSVRFALTGNLWAVADNIASFHALLDDRPAGARSDGPIGSLNLALRREVWHRIGPFDEQLATSEDLDWILRAREAGFEVFFEPEARVEHANVRQSRRDLERHAAWYGGNFNQFRKIHPGVFDRGPTWRSRRRLLWTHPLKAWVAALRIFLQHPTLLPAWRSLPGVIVFKMAWYRAVLDTWREP